MVILCHLTVILVDRGIQPTDKRITCHIFLDLCEKFLLLAEMCLGLSSSTQLDKSKPTDRSIYYL